MPAMRGIAKSRMSSLFVGAAAIAHVPASCWRLRMSHMPLVIFFRSLRKYQPFSCMLTATSGMKGRWNGWDDRGAGSRAFFRLAATGEVTARAHRRRREVPAG